MDITEVRVKLVKNKDDRLRAFCSLTLDGEFVVRDIKVIERPDGYFVAMPSRKITDHCERCGGKNHLRARYFNDCGHPLPDNRVNKDPRGRPMLHADIAHPINVRCRQRIQNKIVVAFKEELERSTQPDYKPVEFDEPEDYLSQLIQ
jgi:stage V sporulation protein G